MVTYSEGYDFNIMNELDNSGVSQDGTSITMNVNFRFKFNDWLSANAIASYTSQNTTIEDYWGGTRPTTLQTCVVVNMVKLLRVVPVYARKGVN